MCAHLIVYIYNNKAGKHYIKFKYKDYEAFYWGERNRKDYIDMEFFRFYLLSERHLDYETANIIAEAVNDNIMTSIQEYLDDNYCWLSVTDFIRVAERPKKEIDKRGSVSIRVTKEDFTPIPIAPRRTTDTMYGFYR